MISLLFEIKIKRRQKFPETRQEMIRFLQQRRQKRMDRKALLTGVMIASSMDDQDVVGATTMAAGGLAGLGASHFVDKYLDKRLIKKFNQNQKNKLNKEKK